MSFLLHFSDYVLGGSSPTDDSVDKLHRKYTILVLLFLSLPLVTRQFAGDPIECFTPTYFTDAQTRYVNSYCWTTSTYYQAPSDVPAKGAQKKLRLQQRSPARSTLRKILTGWQQSEDRDKVFVSYYQWAPIILMVEAVCFYIPFSVWSSVARRSGVRLHRLLKRVGVICQFTPGHPDRESLIVEFCEQLNTLLGVATVCPGSRTCRVTQHNGYLLALYLSTKLLYIANIFLQFFLLSIFLGSAYINHGFQIIRSVFSHRKWYASSLFPLHTLCQVFAANQGALEEYTCQCVLPINLFNEKIFSVLWFYVAALLPLTIYSTAIWVFRSSRAARRNFIRYYLWRTGRLDGERLDRTCRNLLAYLRYDGLLILRLIELNHGTAVLTLIVDKLSEYHDLLDSGAGGGGGRVEEGGVCAASSYLSLSTTRLLSYSGQRALTAESALETGEGIGGGQRLWGTRSRGDISRSRSDLAGNSDNSPDSGHKVLRKKKLPLSGEDKQPEKIQSMFG